MTRCSASCRNWKPASASLKASSRPVRLLRYRARLAGRQRRDARGLRGLAFRARVRCPASRGSPVAGHLPVSLLFSRCAWCHGRGFLFRAVAGCLPIASRLSPARGRRARRAIPPVSSSCRPVRSPRRHRRSVLSCGLTSLLVTVGDRPCPRLRRERGPTREARTRRPVTDGHRAGWLARSCGRAGGWPPRPPGRAGSARQRPRVTWRARPAWACSRSRL